LTHAPAAQVNSWTKLFISRTIPVNVNRTSSAAWKSLVLAASLLFSISAAAQKKSKEPTGPLITRTATRHETYRLPPGGTVTLSAAPAGSIIIEGWQQNAVDLTATIELQGPDATGLDQLAAVNTFVVDVDSDHLRILTSGTHDREFMKKTTKNFPKALIGLPWKIDFHLKIPALTDLEIDAGNGPISLSGVEGALRLNALHSDANLSLTGGLVSVLIQSGTVNLAIPGRSWHGLSAEVKLASGNLNIDLMPGFSADINADVLRFGEIKNSFTGLQPQEQGSVTGRSIRARAGNGGATLNFTVGDGTIVIKQSGDK
jgi:hypothetical protein